MQEKPTRPDDITEPAPTRRATALTAFPPTLADEYLESACTLARGRMSWTPGPGHHSEDLPWLKGATAA